MKHKLIIAGSLLLLVLVIGFMVWDIFLNRPDGNDNPYAYDLDAFRKGDTTRILYSEAAGFEPGLSPLRGIARAGQDRLWVCGDSAAALFDLKGNWLGAFYPGAPPSCVATDSAGLVWLGFDDHLEAFDATGRKVVNWPMPDKGSVITSVSARGSRIFVADAGNREVLCYDRSGNLLRRLGRKDPVKGVPGFIVPSPYFDVLADGRGGVWVANTGRHRLEHYDAEGELKEAWGVASMTTEGFSGCCNPSHFARLDDGSFVTAEKTIERIKLYWPDGTFRGLVAGPASFDEGTRGLDLAVNGGDTIFVIDPVRNRVRMFVPTEKKARNE